MNAWGHTYGVDLTGKPRDLAFAYHHYRTNWKGCQGAMNPCGRSVTITLELVQYRQKDWQQRFLHGYWRRGNRSFFSACVCYWFCAFYFKIKNVICASASGSGTLTRSGYSNTDLFLSSDFLGRNTTRLDKQSLSFNDWELQSGKRFVKGGVMLKTCNRRYDIIILKIM